VICWFFISIPTKNNVLELFRTEVRKWMGSVLLAFSSLLAAHIPLDIQTCNGSERVRDTQKLTYWKAEYTLFALSVSYRTVQSELEWLEHPVASVREYKSPVVRGCKFIAMSPKLMVPGVRFRTLLPRPLKRPLEGSTIFWWSLCCCSPEQGFSVFLGGVNLSLTLPRCQG